MKKMSSYRRGPTKHSGTALHITTTQKVLVGVALLASVGAFAAGFAAIPRGEKGKCDGKGCQYASGQYTTRQPMTRQPKTNQPAKTAPTYKAIRLEVGTAYRTTSGTLDMLYYAKDKKFYYLSPEAAKTWGGAYKLSTVQLPVEQFMVLGGVKGSVRPRTNVREGAKTIDQDLRITN